MPLAKPSERRVPQDAAGADFAAVEVGQRVAHNLVHAANVVPTTGRPQAMDSSTTIG